MDGLGPARRGDGGLVDLRRRVGLVPVPGGRGRMGDEPGGEGEVVAMPLARQEIGDDGPPDELVAEVDAGRRRAR